MKSALFISVLFTALSAFSATTSPTKSYSFQYKAAKLKPFAITQTAATKDEAYKLAARECFKKLTGNHYPGEEKGLEIIDICANPKM
jgi:hypothetical protein